MKWHQGEVIQRFLRSAQGCFQNLGCALDDLHQVVVHGAGHVEDERQSGCPLRDRLCCGRRVPSVLPGTKGHWQREVQPQQSAAHLKVKMLQRKSSCSGQSVCQRVSRINAGRMGVSETGLGLRNAFRFLCTFCRSLSSRCELKACSCKLAVPVVCRVRSLFNPVTQRPPLSWAVSQAQTTPCCIALLSLDKIQEILRVKYMFNKVHPDSVFFFFLLLVVIPEFLKAAQWKHKRKSLDLIRSSADRKAAPL